MDLLRPRFFFDPKFLAGIEFFLRLETGYYLAERQTCRCEDLLVGISFGNFVRMPRRDLFYFFPMKNDFLISVVIPAYNEEGVIDNCLASLLDQTVSQEDYEIIVVDNNSTDRT